MHERKWQCRLCDKPYWWPLQEVRRHEKTNEHQSALECEELKAAAGFSSSGSDTNSQAPILSSGTVVQEITQVLDPHPLVDSNPLQDEPFVFENDQNLSMTLDWANIEFEEAASSFDRETLLSNYTSSLARYVLGGHSSNSDSEPDQPSESESDAGPFRGTPIIGMWICES